MDTATPLLASTFAPFRVPSQAGEGCGEEGPHPHAPVRTVTPSIFQSPSTRMTCTRMTCRHDCAPSGVTSHAEPCGGAWLPLLTDLTTYLPKTTRVAASCASLICCSPTSSTSRRVVAEAWVALSMIPPWFQSFWYWSRRSPVSTASLRCL